MTNGHLKEQPPEPSPKLNIEININIPAYRQIRKSETKLPNQPRTFTTNAIADTGAQTCTTGLHILQTIPEEWLIPTKHKLRGVDNNPLPIKGVLFVDISTKTRQTTQLLYVCENVTGTYLSQSSLKDLDIIQKTFPNSTIAATETDTTDSSKNQTTVQLAPCGCPLRTECPPTPTKLPYPADEEHRHDLEQWILQYYSSSAFNVCPHQKLQTMTGEKLNITFKPDATPRAIHKPIPVPHHWKEKVKTQLDADVALGIIEPVPQGVPTHWCSRMVVVSKKDGSPRRTVDLQALNKATLRETHHTPTPFHIVSSIPPRTKKTVIDAWNGYHSVPLTPESCEATTFITEWGRYRYKRAPQGFHGSNDGYTKRFDDITVDFPRTKRCIDDSLLYDSDIANSFWHIISYIELCARNGIVFNPVKFEFAHDTTEFAGFDITPEGFRPTERIMKAILEFPTPKNISDIRSWFGLVAQVSYAFAQAPVMAPFRELLSKKTPFYWDETLQSLFDKTKLVIIDSIKEGVQSFSTNKTTCLATDWSKTGIGFTLTQKHCQCIGKDPLCGPGHWRMVYAGSRFTNEAESNYAPIEGEALALLFGLESCRMFVLGCPDLLIAVDHEPLVPIFNDRDLERIKNIRLLKIREKTLHYQFVVKAIPGAKNVGPNTASRIPPVVSSRVGSIEESLPNTTRDGTIVSSISFDTIVDHASKDEQYNQLVSLIEKGFPEDKTATPKTLHDFWPLRKELYTLQNIVFIANKPLIPKSLRRDILHELHLGHQGVSMMKSNARQRFFWPHMNADINSTRLNCQRCNQTAPSQPKTSLQLSEDPEYPFQQTVTDLLHMVGHNFIIYADRFSGWNEVADAKKSNATAVCNTLRRYFETFGVPEEMSSDGGPPFNSNEYATFLKDWNVTHRLSSPYYAQSNGRAKAAVKTLILSVKSWWSNFR